MGDVNLRPSDARPDRGLHSRGPFRRLRALGVRERRRIHGWRGSRCQGDTATPIYRNDNWGNNADADNTAATAASVFAFALQDGSADAAFVVTLQPGVYTVVGSSADGAGAGVAIVEVYAVP